MQPALDRRTRDHLTQVRSTVEESWMDVQAASFEIRREVARAYLEHQHGHDPLPHLFAADRRLMRLTEHARRRAAEAAGITYISPEQLPLFDG